MVLETIVIHLEISGEHVFNRLQDLREEQLTFYYKFIVYCMHICELITNSCTKKCCVITLK